MPRVPGVQPRPPRAAPGAAYHALQGAVGFDFYARLPYTEGRKQPRPRYFLVLRPSVAAEGRSRLAFASLTPRRDILPQGLPRQLRERQTALLRFHFEPLPFGLGEPEIERARARRRALRFAKKRFFGHSPPLFFV